MTRIDSFARSARFAAIAALGWIPWLLVAAPLLGGPAARTLYLVAVTALYAAGLASSARRRASAILVGGLAGGVLACVAPGIPELCVGLALVLGTVRCGVVHRGNPIRAVAIEGMLLVGGLVFARFLAGGTVQGVALALWGFLLVQSCLFLVGGIDARGSGARRGDPFEEAVARATEVLEGPIA